MAANPTVARPLSGIRRAATTRRGSMLIALLAAAAAAAVLLAYLRDYRSDVRAGTAPAQVLVADRLIKKGTTGDAIVAESQFRPLTVAEDDLVVGALADASVLAGKVAAKDVFPGQQLTAADFTTGGDAIRGRLTGTQRAVGVPVDAAHGLVGRVKPGDSVDVFASFASDNGRGVVRTLARGSLVLAVPSTDDAAGVAGDGTADPVVLRLDGVQAARLAYAADNGKVWFALRPTAGAREGAPDVVTSEAAR